MEKYYKEQPQYSPELEAVLMTAFDHFEERVVMFEQFVEYVTYCVEQGILNIPVDQIELYTQLHLDIIAAEGNIKHYSDDETVAENNFDELSNEIELPREVVRTCLLAFQSFETVELPVEELIDFLLKCGLANEAVAHNAVEQLIENGVISVEDDSKMEPQLVLTGPFQQIEKLKVSDLAA